MTRPRSWALIVLLALGLLAAPLAAEAQQTGKVYRVGLLGMTSATAITNPVVTAFRARLRELGYVEGGNLIIEYRWPEGKVERLPSLAAELVERRVDVIVVAAVPSALAAKRATTTIPIVFVGLPDPVALGLVGSLSRPGSNLTGLSGQASSQQAEKELELLKQLAPTASRVALLRDKHFPAEAGWLYQPYVSVAAQAMRLTFSKIDLQDPADLDNAFARMAEARAEALWIVLSPMMYAARRRIAELSIAHRLPSVASAREFVEAGGLASYGANGPDLWRRAAGYVDKILKGAKPADLPVEQPMKFELVINLKTAKALGLTIPQSLLVRTDELLQ